MRLNYFMRLEDFNYRLPKNLIAQTPMRPRDKSRLLVCIKRRTTNAAHANLNKEECKIEHKHFYDIIDYLDKGDVLVLNNSKVFPARLIGRKISTGGKIEVFLLKASPLSPLLVRRGVRGEVGEAWQCLVGNHGRKENLMIEFNRGLKAKVLKHNQDGTWLVEFNKGGRELMKVVNQIGQVPLPPYLKGKRDSTCPLCLRKQGRRVASLQNDRINYQTVYAKKLGSVAAPTAGLHFTPALLKKIKTKGVRIEYVTLHVGLGTFAPVKVDDITKHKMHAEWVEVSGNTIKRIIKVKSEGRRIIAVGTTSVRTLESVFRNKRGSTSKLEVEPQKDFCGWTDIFIYPPYKFKIVDAMITNFHLPKSTLLMLVSAFATPSAKATEVKKAPADKSALAGRNKIFKAYQEAIKKKYRFYSYGDAMFIY